MLRFLRAATAVGLLVTICSGAGFVHNENFVVLTDPVLAATSPTEYATLVLAKAEEYRKKIALEWFGEELPPGIGRTTINVRYAPDRDSALTWAVDHPDRKLHTVYLYTKDGNSTASTLAHEIAHVVLATQFPHPHRLPAWVEEGIASQYDDAERQRTRRSVMRYFARQEAWPSVESVLLADNIAAENTRSYAVAVSLTEMLLSKGGKRTLLDFGRAASREGVQPALARFYRLQEVAQLQTQWQDWAAQLAGRETQLSQVDAPPRTYGQ
jgi:hypothetical protein